MSEAVECEVTAGLLESGTAAGYAAHAGAIVAGLGLYSSGPQRWALAAALAVWMAAVYLHIRVALDAKLFRLLASSPSNVDRILLEAGLIPEARERSLGDRRRGALSLWKKLIAALVAELVCLAIGVALTLR